MPGAGEDTEQLEFSNFAAGCLSSIWETSDNIFHVWTKICRYPATILHPNCFKHQRNLQWSPKKTTTVLWLLTQATVWHRRTRGWRWRAPGPIHRERSFATNVYSFIHGCGAQCNNTASLWTERPCLSKLTTASTGFTANIRKLDHERFEGEKVFYHWHCLD